MFHYVLFNDALLFFLFSRRIALQSISYMVKTFAAKPLVANMFTAEELMPKISPDHLLHPRCLWICMGSLPSSLCASAHLFPLLRMPGGIPLIASLGSCSSAPWCPTYPSPSTKQALTVPSRPLPPTMGTLGEQGPHFFPDLNNEGMYTPSQAITNQ